MTLNEDLRATLAQGSRTWLVTGVAGFIGSNFGHDWMKKYPDDEIINLDKLTYAGNLENLKDVDSITNLILEIKGS